MSAFKEAVDAIKGALLLADKVDRVGQSLQELASDVVDHEKRLIRLETRWETAVELTQGRMQRLSKD